MKYKWYIMIYQWFISDISRIYRKIWSLNGSDDISFKDFTTLIYHDISAIYQRYILTIIIYQNDIWIYHRHISINICPAIYLEYHIIYISVIYQWYIGDTLLRLKKKHFTDMSPIYWWHIGETSLRNNKYFTDISQIYWWKICEISSIYRW